jgi:hypothetical protein
MTMEKKVDMLQRMMPGDNMDQGILEVYLELAGQKILNRMYPFKDNYDGLEVPDRYVAVQLKIANYMINKIGAEGQIQHIENGIHRNYGSADIPDGMMEEVVPFCQAIR